MTRSKTLALAATLSIALCAAQGRRPVAFSVVEAGIPEMKAALEQGRVTSRELVTHQEHFRCRDVLLELHDIQDRA